MNKKALAVVALPDGRLPDARAVKASDPTALQRRIDELESLCAEVYVAAVELGLPQPLLNRLWIVAAQGRTPHAYDLEMPPRPKVVPAPDAAVTSESPTAEPQAAQPPQLPDIRLTDRRRDGETPRPRPAQPDLLDLPERRTVMVVDDDEMMLEVLVRILRRENYELVTASSGAEALERAAVLEGSVHLLITDYVMPEMRGRELAERLRERYPDLKVLYQTGFSDMLFEDRIELEDGSAFLEKPFTARGLREAARFSLFTMLNPPPPAAES